MPFFDPSQRDILYSHLVKMGQSDVRISAGALVGSYALNKQDSWSDLDISFCVISGFSPLTLLDEWTEEIKKQYKVVHYFDVPSSLAIYRVLLLESGLELDLSMVPESEFSSKGPSFKLLFGKAINNNNKNVPNMNTLIGWSWHHVLHANSAMNRSKKWQAQFWINGLRNYLISMKCVRYKLPYLHGRGADNLPSVELKKMEETIPKHSTLPELRKCLNKSSQLLVEEIGINHPDLATSLTPIFSLALHPEVPRD